MKRLHQLLPPIVAAVIGFGGWELLLRLTQPDGFVLPAPSKIAEAVLENSEAIQTGTRVTGFIVVSGLLAGVFFGIAAALLVTAFRTANETLTPLAVADQRCADRRAGTDIQCLVRAVVSSFKPSRCRRPSFLSDLHQYIARTRRG